MTPRLALMVLLVCALPLAAGAAQPTNTFIVQSAPTSRFGEPVHLFATTTNSGVLVPGTLTFRDGGTVLGASAITFPSNGAAFSISSLETGSHSLTAAFPGNASYNASTSVALSHSVLRGETGLTFVTNHVVALYGEPLRVYVTVTPQAPASGQPGGTVTILADGVAIGSGTVFNGYGQIEVPAPRPGNRSITATYAGDAHFEGSSATKSQSVARAPTAVDAQVRNPLNIGSPAIVLVDVRATTNASLIPTGEVTVTEGNTVLGRQTLASGHAAVDAGLLSPGLHELHVTYPANDDFIAGTGTVVQRVIVPTLAVSGLQIVEGNSGSTVVPVVVTLSVPAQAAVRVSFTTVAGTAIEGVDYEKAGGVIEFGPGEQTRVVELRILGDPFLEGDETFSLFLSSPSNAAIETPSALIVIGNDDQLPARRRPSRH